MKKKLGSFIKQKTKANNNRRTDYFKSKYRTMHKFFMLTAPHCKRQICNFSE